MRTNISLRFAFGLALLASAACKATVPEGAYACEKANQCPGGWVCVAKHCYSSPSAAADADAKTDAGAGHAGTSGSGGTSGSDGGNAHTGSGGDTQRDAGDSTSDAASDAGREMPPSSACTKDCAVGAKCSDAKNCESGACVDDACRPACTGHCDDGEKCVNHDDCASDICTRGKCQSSCDGICAAGDACQKNDDCVSNVCDANECRPECSGSCEPGDECIEAGDCATQVCKAETCRPECSGSCAVADACVADSDCAGGICTGGLCRLACAADKTCQPGDACAADADCAGTTICDPEAKLCLQICVAPSAMNGPQLQIASQDDLDDWKWCKELQGTLTFIGDLPAVDATAFPYLAKITNDLLIAPSSALVNVTLSALTSVEGNVLIEESSAPMVVSLPALETIGTPGAPKSLQIGLTEARRVEIPKLTTIYGEFYGAMCKVERLDLRGLTTVTTNFTLGYMTKLVSLNVSSLTTIGGNLQLTHLLELPAGAISPFDSVTVGGTRMPPASIGCCAGLGSVQLACDDDPSTYYCDQ